MNSNSLPLKKGLKYKSTLGRPQRYDPNAVFPEIPQIQPGMPPPGMTQQHWSLQQGTSMQQQQMLAMYGAGGSAVAAGGAAGGAAPGMFRPPWEGSRGTSLRDPLRFTPYPDVPMAPGAPAKPQPGFTLNPGQQRYDAAGNLIASSAPKPGEAPKPTPAGDPRQNYIQTAGGLFNIQTGQIEPGTTDPGKVPPGGAGGGPPKPGSSGGGGSPHPDPVGGQPGGGYGGFVRGDPRYGGTELGGGMGYGGQPGGGGFIGEGGQSAGIGNPEIPPYVAGRGGFEYQLKQPPLGAPSGGQSGGYAGQQQQQPTEENYNARYMNKADGMDRSNSRELVKGEREPLYRHYAGLTARNQAKNAQVRASGAKKQVDDRENYSNRPGRFANPSMMPQPRPPAAIRQRRKLIGVKRGNRIAAVDEFSPAGQAELRKHPRVGGGMTKSVEKAAPNVAQFRKNLRVLEGHWRQNQAKVVPVRDTEETSEGFRAMEQHSRRVADNAHSRARHWQRKFGIDEATYTKLVGNTQFGAYGSNPVTKTNAANPMNEYVW